VGKLMCCPPPIERVAAVDNSMPRAAPCATLLRGKLHHQWPSSVKRSRSEDHLNRKEARRVTNERFRPPADVAKLSCSDDRLGRDDLHVRQAASTERTGIRW